MKRPLLGAHMSIAGGVSEALIRARDTGCECVQIFTKSSRQWVSKPYAKEEVANFKRVLGETGIKTVIAHDSYLINLGAPDENMRKKSLAGFIDELERCELLGVPVPDRASRFSRRRRRRYRHQDHREIAQRGA